MTRLLIQVSLILISVISFGMSNSSMHLLTEPYTISIYFYIIGICGKLLFFKLLSLGLKFFEKSPVQSKFFQKSPAYTNMSSNCQN
jgi:hypothetical protein